MIILTKCGRFYARLDFNHDFGPPEAAFRQRFSVECDVEVLWTEAGDEPISRETLAAWEKEFQELVRESAPLWPALSGWDRKPASQRPGRNGSYINTTDTKPEEVTTEPITEATDYVRACINSGICASRGSRCYDPDDPDIFERYFGRKPTADELDQLQLDGGILEWWGD